MRIVACLPLIVAALASSVSATPGIPSSGRPPDARSSVRGTRPTVVATSVDAASAVRLDGEPNDEAWLKAPAITEFVQRDPHEGRQPSHPTEARVLYDREALYVAVRAFDAEPSKIVGILSRRDTDSPSDWVGVIVDSYHDRRTAYEFSVNAAGVKADRYRFNDTNEDVSWDAVWDVKVTRDDRGWLARFRIPFSQLRFDPVRADTFGLAITRRIGRLNELSTWPLISKSATGIVSSLGELTGLQLAGGHKRLELVPYAVAQVQAQPAAPGNPFVDTRDPGAAFGADVKFALTPGLTLTGTLNPDFGQVEADPAVVNLSAFETYFAERRPFFIEGSGIFRFDIDCNDGECRGLFYSRRIGRTPRGVPETPPDGGYAWTPLQTTILGAAKLTGRAGAFSLGALNAITGEESAKVFSAGVTTRPVAEPLTSYSVARAKREFADQSSLGFMATATNRQVPADVSFLPGQAYTGGADWDWRLGKTYSLSGYWAGSVVRGSEEAISGLQESAVHVYQRPDADHVEFDPTRTGLGGMSASLNIARIGGNRVRFSNGVWMKTPGFDINDLGFLQRADERGVSNWFQIREDTPSRHLRFWRLNFNHWALWNFAGDRMVWGGNVNAHARTTGNHQAAVGFTLEAEGFDDRLTRGGPGGLVTPGRFLWHTFTTDDRKAIRFTYDLQGGTDGHGSSRWGLGPTIQVRPSSALLASVGLRFNKNIDQTQWVENVTDTRDHYVFGYLHQTTVSATLRLNYTITPTLSIQLYAQPFVSAGAYTSFKELVDGRAARYEDRYASYPYAGNPDFNYRSFRTTNVLRWEYRPGSTVFVVWQQGREESLADGTFSFRRDFGNAFAAAGRNVFLVKMAHWLNF